MVLLPAPLQVPVGIGGTSRGLSDVVAHEALLPAPQQIPVGIGGTGRGLSDFVTHEALLPAPLQVPVGIGGTGRGLSDVVTHELVCSGLEPFGVQTLDYLFVIRHRIPGGDFSPPHGSRTELLFPVYFERQLVVPTFMRI